MKIKRSELKALIQEVLEEGPLSFKPRDGERKASWFRVELDGDYDVIVSGHDFGNNPAAIKSNIEKRFKGKVTDVRKIK
jgi:hypothetical protein|tara:strand:- start:90 stop:326 length:237 start_codon:yes stop_codon:yes gene_type:complete